MRFDEARARRRLGAYAWLPYLLNGLKALNTTIGYLLIATISESLFGLPFGPLLLLAIFIASFCAFSIIDISFKKDSRPQSEFLVQAAILLFFCFLWLAFVR